MNFSHVKLLTMLTFLAGFGQGNLQAASNVAQAGTQKARATDRAKLQAASSQTLLTTTSCPPIGVPSGFAYSIKHSDKCKTTYICPSTFEKKGQNGIVIDEPGTYALSGNVWFNPNQPNVQAITITASNVTLDLGSHFIRQANSQPGVYGIAIARNVHNVKITGSEGVAEILNFTLAGIRVLGNTDQITLENVTVDQSTPVFVTDAMLPDSCTDLGCTPITGGIYVGEGERSGYAFYGTNKNNHVTNLVINNVNAKKCIFGAQIIEAYGVQISNSCFVENTVLGLVMGDYLPVPGDMPNTYETIVGSDITITNCHFDRNTGDSASLTSPTASIYQQASGVQLSEVYDVYMENCTASDNFDTTISYGGETSGVHNLTIRNSSFDNNRGPNDSAVGLLFCGFVPVDGAECVGIGAQLDNPTASVMLDGCTANENQGTGFQFTGLDAAHVTNCTANGNFMADFSGGQTTGFSVQGNPNPGANRGITFLSCTASGNGNQGIFGAAAGFSVRSNSQNVTFRDCVASENGQSNQNLAASAAGFYLNTSTLGSAPFTTSSQNIVIDNCIAIGNGTAQQTGANTGGIVLRAVSSRPPMSNVLIQNCTLAYNTKGIFAVTDMPGVVVKRCELDQNRLVGIDLTNITSSKLVTKNIAYANGPAGTVNYVGIPAANIVTFASTALPAGGVVGFKNIAITP